MQIGKITTTQFTMDADRLHIYYLYLFSLLVKVLVKTLSVLVEEPILAQGIPKAKSLIKSPSIRNL
jgi:hypothetical protein